MYLNRQTVNRGVHYVVFPVQIVLFLLCALLLSSLPMQGYGEELDATGDVPNRVRVETVTPNSTVLDDLADVINPFRSTCYDWSGKVIPCDFKGQYGEFLLGTASPEPRFKDSGDGTVTDNLTGLIWLKNANCFGMKDWSGAVAAVGSLKNGDCGPDPHLVLSDGSSAGDWRLPTMQELCTLIDFSNRNPALPNDNKFSTVPSGYYWSSTPVASSSGLVWVVYIDVGTTCYDHARNRAGYVLPVREPSNGN